MAFMGLFLLPFGAVGIGTAAKGVQRVAQGNWQEGLALLLFGLVFAGFTAGAVSLMIVGRRKLNDLERLRGMHPEQPWLWQREWASGRIQDSGRWMLWGAWIFATIWNLVAVPVGFIGVRAALQEGNRAGLVALLFPLAGIGLLIWAIRTTLRYVKYGTSRLDLSTVPGVIGHTIAGTVRLPSPIQSKDGFEVTLTCLRRVTTGSSKNRSSSERVLWQDQRRIGGEVIRDAEGAGVRVPINFRIPADAPASDSADSNNQIVWRLSLSAQVPGVDYQSVFDVPVYRTAASEFPLPEEAERREDERAEYGQYRQPATSRITVTRNQRGTEIYFPAARNPGATAGVIVITILWTGVLAALVHFKAPLVFVLGFGLFELLLMFITLQLCLGVSRVTAERGMITIAHGYLHPGREQRIQASEVADVSTRIGMQAGSTPYYDVVVLRKGGRSVIAGRSVRDKREAEWLAVTLRDAIGVIVRGGLKVGSQELSRAPGPLS